MSNVGDRATVYVLALTQVHPHERNIIGGVRYFDVHFTQAFRFSMSDLT